MNNNKKWRVRQADPVMQFILSRKLGVSPLLAQLLINRGIYSVDAARDFLAASLDGLYRPWLMTDMDAGVRAVSGALDRQAKILVYGDYDVDGVTGTALLVEVLQRLGGHVEYYIPQRLDLGYSLHTPVLRRFREKGVEMVITVDCGISNAAEVRAAQVEGGPEIVITDHHEPPSELPPATAVINPKRRDCGYPFRELAGVGVAYKFARALLEYRSVTVDPEEYLDLVCLGTIADIVPLQGENRILVKHGLAKMARLERPGLQALCRAAGVKQDSLGTREVGYILAPRLNAAGRLGDAGTAVELLLSKDIEQAQELASLLVRDNQARQELETVALGEALGMLDADPALATGGVIVLDSPRWHPGVIGIVASRLVNRYNKPVFLVAGEGDRGKGSARGVRGFDLVAALEHCSRYLLEFGGHAMAAGFSIPMQNITQFREALNRYAEEKAGAGDQRDTLELDALVSMPEITPQLVGELAQLEPHGHGNTRPLLGLTGARLLHCRGVGKNEAHLKLLLGEKSSSIDGIGFNLGGYASELAAGTELDVAFTPTINHWQGRQYLQIRVSDLHPEDGGLVGNFREDEMDILKRAGDLLLVPESMVARLKDFLLQNGHPLPPEMMQLQVHTRFNGTKPPVPPLPGPLEGNKTLSLLEPEDSCILLLVNSARHTLQLARFFDRCNHSFSGRVSFINGFMPGDRLEAELHRINNGPVKLLISTYSCLPLLKEQVRCFDRIIMARPPASGEEWAAVAGIAGNGAGPEPEAAYTHDHWEQNRSCLAELAPEREALACCYAVLRSLAGKGTGTCAGEELLDHLRHSGFQVTSRLFLAVSAAIFSDLELLQYRWEEGMLRYKLIPPGGQRRELDASSTFNWARKVKSEWLRWFESGSRTNGGIDPATG